MDVCDGGRLDVLAFFHWSVLRRSWWFPKEFVRVYYWCASIGCSCHSDCSLCVDAFQSVGRGANTGPLRTIAWGELSDLFASLIAVYGGRRRASDVYILAVEELSCEASG